MLRLVALGYTNQEVADQLYLSVRTVEAHRAALHRKLRAKHKADLVKAALSGGLLHPPGFAARAKGGKAPGPDAKRL